MTNDADELVHANTLYTFRTRLSLLYTRTIIHHFILIYYIILYLLAIGEKFDDEMNELHSADNNNEGTL